MSQIVQIDVTKLDEEIEQLRTKLNEKLFVKEQIIRLSEEYGVQVNGTAPDEKPAAVASLPKSAAEAFILESLSGGEKRNDKIQENYARLQGKGYSEVKEEFNQALNKLKDSGEIVSEYRPSLKRTVIMLKGRKAALLESWLLQDFGSG